MDFSQVLFKRRSIRRFTGDPVSENEISALIEAARVAPSAANRQSLRFFAITTRDMMKKILPLTRWGAKVAPRRNPVFGENAPSAFIAVCVKGKNPDWLSGCDTGAAVENILLRAVDMGLGCCWLAAFDHAGVDAMLPLPDGMHTISLIAVGHPGEAPEMVDTNNENQIDYYLDDQDTLHVPKLAVENLVTFVK